MKKNKEKKFTIIFILTLLTLPIGIITLIKYADFKDSVGIGIFDHYSSHVYILLFFLPIPLLSFIIGIINRKERYALKNIVLGAFVSFLIIFYSTSILLVNPQPLDYNYVFNYEKILNVNLPEKGFAIKSINGLNIRYQNVKYDELEKSILSNTNWMKSSNINYNDLKILYYGYYYKDDNVYILLYNKTLDEYNKQPIEKGNYEFLVALYRFKNKQLMIYEFDYTNN